MSDSAAVRLRCQQKITLNALHATIFSNSDSSSTFRKH